MSIPWSQARTELDRRTAQVSSLIDRYSMLEVELTHALGPLEEHLRQARIALASAYLPTLLPTAMERAERLTGFRGFSRRDPFKAMEQRRVTLEKTIARIQADERYQRRVGLVGAGGELSEKLKEAREMAAPFEAECARFEGQPLFKELMDAFYDSPQFTYSWWQGEYWKLWAAGDRICAALGMNDFGDDVRPAYQAALKERTFWYGEIDRIQGLIADVHGLVEEHDRSLATLPRLGEVILEECWGVLADFFAQADEALLAAWLAKEPADDAAYTRPIEVALKRSAGLGAKRRFIIELGEGLKSLVAELTQRRMRLYTRLHKLENSSKMRNRPVMPSYVDAAFEPKRVKLEAQLGKVRSLIEKLLRNEKFDRFELSDNPSLWWAHFTGGAPPRLMPKLRVWYERNPRALAVQKAAREASQKAAKATDERALTADAVATVVSESPSAAADGPGGYLS
jgi:hypothetical protein